MTLSEEIDMVDFIRRVKAVTDEDIDRFTYVGVSSITLLRKSVEKVIIGMGHSCPDSKQSVIIWRVVTEIYPDFGSEFNDRCVAISKSAAPEI